VLECELSDPEGVVNWFKNKRPINDGGSGGRIKIDRAGCTRRLTISPAAQEDTGIYVCETSDERSRSQCDLVVRAEEPHIKFSPQDRAIRAYGEKIQLRAEITKEVSEVRWLKNGFELWQQTGKHFMFMEECYSYLEIYNFDERDIGDYVMVLPNNERSAPAKLRLEVPPKLELSKEVRDKDELELCAGKDLHFEVIVSGYPKPTFEAVHGEQALRRVAQMDQYEVNVLS